MSDKLFSTRLRLKILHHLTRKGMERDILYKLCDGADPTLISRMLSKLKKEKKYTFAITLLNQTITGEKLAGDMRGQ